MKRIKRRNTPAKERVLELFSKHHLLSGPELIAKLPSIDASTIYRNLSRFLEDGIIKETTFFGLGTAKYELVREVHHHFLCRKCGTLESIMFDYAVILDALPRNTRIDEVELFASGVCGKCEKRN